jgi:poly-D-alanine transfer protein DltD
MGNQPEYAPDFQRILNEFISRSPDGIFFNNPVSWLNHRITALFYDFIADCRFSYESQIQDIKVYCFFRFKK